MRFLLQTLPPPRLMMLRVRAVTVRCRWETEMCWEVSHPQPDCDTFTKKQLGTKAICCSSYRLDPQGSLSLGATSPRLDLKAASCLQKTGTTVSQLSHSRSSKAEAPRAAAPFLHSYPLKLILTPHHIPSLRGKGPEACL